MVLDCSDNFRTKYSLNEACVNNNISFCSASVSGSDGQIALFQINQNIIVVITVFFQKMAMLMLMIGRIWSSRTYCIIDSINTILNHFKTSSQ
ncbi:MAG: hypothetical protein Ct9H90mP19_5630 [Gammaproteobacteria bacterium]|nr:MAG: hypothetical protein Ct9H90mP19_5630 [Gammaproteobacteria bacterium]